MILSHDGVIRVNRRVNKPVFDFIDVMFGQKYAIKLEEVRGAPEDSIKLRTFTIFKLLPYSVYCSVTCSVFVTIACQLIFSWPLTNSESRMPSSHQPPFLSKPAVVSDGRFYTWV